MLQSLTYSKVVAEEMILILGLTVNFFRRCQKLVGFVGFECFHLFPTFKALSLTFMSKISGPLADFQKWCQRKGRAWWSTSARRCSPACPCRPAFVCNYCLIKHAGQLPVSDWLASDTQLYTECLQPQSIRVRPFCFTLWSFAQTTVVITITAASICNTISLTNAWVLQTERLLLLQLWPNALSLST